MNPKILLACLAVALTPAASPAQRQMENLNRGVVAVRTGSGATFVSWRVLGLDASSTTFNLYRSTNGGAATKLNPTPLSVSNYTDSSASSANAYTYSVRPVVGGVEQSESLPFTLAANGPTEMAFRIPIRSLANHQVHFVWVGDLDGDGEYDYVLDRLPTTTTGTQKLEAYTRTGTLLWVVDLGPNSVNPDNIEPTPSAIDVGHWDGVTVYDFDGDGKAEVALRIADGVVFGNGTTVSGLGANVQAVSILNGLTGAERARAPVPQDYISDGPMPAHFGVAYLNGTTPSLVGKFKNRIGTGDFNLMTLAWDFANNSLAQKWKWLRGSADLHDFHQIRIFDVNQDGIDEICDGGYALNANGTFRYKVGGSSLGVVHGDRFHISDLNPNRAGLEGFGIQQNQPDGLLYLTYDAATGATINAHSGAVEDTARGVVADIDPAYPGFEYWSFHGLHRIDTGAVVSSTTPWPNFRIWWDGDVLSETLNDGKVEKWDPATGGLTRLFTVGSTTTSGVAGTTSDRGAPQFYGDIVGDWREEIISTNSDYTQLIVCTTKTPTSVRLYTLAHNPAYRASMTIKGYMQSHQPDYYLGHGMSTPPQPNIAYVGGGGGTPTAPTAPGSLGATATSACQVNLAWNDNSSDESGFKIERSLNGSSFSQVATVGVNTTGYADTGRAASTTYYYRVRAYNSAGDSAYSNTDSATTLAAPAAPSSLGTTSVSSSRIDLAWTDNASTESGFAIERSTDNAAFTEIATIGSNATSYSATGLSASTTYYFRISAYDACGNASAYSDTASATTAASSTPPSFVAAGGVAAGTGAITPSLPSGIASGDILLLFIENANQTASLSNQNGGAWASVTGALQGTGSGGGSSSTKIAVYWSRYNGGQGAPTVADSGNHQLARIIAIRGAASAGDPWDVVAGGIESTSDTSGSIPGATTSVSNTLVVLAAAASLPDANSTSQFSGWTNANLANVTERTDNTTNAGNGGGLGIATGEKASAGSYGATTVTHANSAAKAFVSIAIKK